MAHINEAYIDVIANKHLGYGSFQYREDDPKSDLTARALAGDRAALRKLVKDAIRDTRDEIASLS